MLRRTTLARIEVEVSIECGTSRCDSFVIRRGTCGDSDDDNAIKPIYEDGDVAAGVSDGGPATPTVHTASQQQK